MSGNCVSGGGLNPLPEIDLRSRPDVVRSKRLAGLIYGAVCGLAFALAGWGWDGYILSRSHAYLPWFNLGMAMILGAGVGAVTGWLTARLENALAGVLFWLVATGAFAALVILLPLYISPFLISRLNPELSTLLQPPAIQDFGLLFGVVFAWCLPFVIIAGVVQLPLTESAVFATSFFGKILPFLFSVILIVVCGTITDSLINAHLREAVTSLDATIQFVLDQADHPQQDEARARAMHVSALRGVQEYVTESYKLIVRSHDQAFGEIHVLVRFDHQWVDCMVIHGQPALCSEVR